MAREPLPSRQPADQNSAVSQFDLFPERVTVNRIDARATVGERCAVLGES